jgi:hypothetical protein
MIMLRFYGKSKRYGFESYLSNFLCLLLIIRALYLPNDGQESRFKKISKFTLKQLRHVSV